MGNYIRQGKTKRWVGIPVAGGMHKRIEAAIAANAKRAIPSTNLLVSERTGRSWASSFQFIRDFNAVRKRAVTPTAKDLAAGAVAHPPLEELKFLDLRRTCVVRLGELGLEDALIAAITGHSWRASSGSSRCICRGRRRWQRAVVARIGDRRDAVTKEKPG